MSGHPAVAFLQQAHEGAVRTADRLHTELWWISKAARIDVFDGQGALVDGVGVHNEAGCQVVSTTEAIQRALLVGSPVDLLRRVAAERQILAEHQRFRNVLGGKTLSVVPYCHRCGHLDEDPVRWPCRTVLLLAEGWGRESPVTPPSR